MPGSPTLAASLRGTIAPTNTVTGEKLVYSPAEFAGLFGHAPVWGYRRIYAGDVRIVKHAGRMLISHHEVKRFIATSEIYSGRKATKRGRNNE